MRRPPPRSTLFPYTTLFRSAGNHLTYTTNTSDITLTTDATNSNAVSTIVARDASGNLDRKSTRLNSSHVSISYAVFCLKKKNNIKGYRVGDNVRLVLYGHAA